MARIEHFAIYGENVVALKDFYVRFLGMRVVHDSGGDPPAYFLADDHGMAIEVLARPAGHANVNQRFICHFAFWVDDFAGKLAELQGHGIAPETETFADNNEIKTAFFNDPAGNRCQIVWRRKRLGASD